MFASFVVNHYLQTSEIHSRVRQKAHAADLRPVGVVREDELHALRSADPAERPAGIVAFHRIGIGNDEAGLIHAV